MLSSPPFLSVFEERTRENEGSSVISASIVSKDNFKPIFLGDKSMGYMNTILDKSYDRNIKLEETLRLRHKEDTNKSPIVRQSLHSSQNEDIAFSYQRD